MKKSNHIKKKPLIALTVILSLVLQMFMPMQTVYAMNISAKFIDGTIEILDIEPSDTIAVSAVMLALTGVFAMKKFQKTYTENK